MPGVAIRAEASARRMSLKENKLCRLGESARKTDCRHRQSKRINHRSCCALTGAQTNGNRRRFQHCIGELLESCRVLQENHIGPCARFRPSGKPVGYTAGPKLKRRVSCRCTDLRPAVPRLMDLYGHVKAAFSQRHSDPELPLMPDRSIVVFVFEWKALRQGLIRNTVEEAELLRA